MGASKKVGLLLKRQKGEGREAAAGVAENLFVEITALT